MHFDINQKRYVVLIARGPVMVDGRDALAKIDHRVGRIFISDQIPKNDRRKLLFHEFRHGWIGAHGRAADDEADADQFADAVDALVEQFLAQGGDAALEALTPDPDNSRRASATLALTVAHCGYCEAPMAVGSIANGLPEWSASHNAFVLDRGILCSVCDRVSTWREICTEQGEPTGAILPFPQPRVLAGPAAAQWLAAHQDEARVRVVA